MKDKITFKEEYWDNGKLRYRHQLVNSKHYGEQLGYYDNGQLDYRYQLLNGKYHGESLSYLSSGKIYSKYYYINGERVSQEEWLEYNTSKHQTQFLTDMYV